MKKKALNYKAQQVIKDLFETYNTTADTKGKREVTKRQSQICAENIEVH